MHVYRTVWTTGRHAVYGVLGVGRRAAHRTVLVGCIVSFALGSITCGFTGLQRCLQRPICSDTGRRRLARVAWLTLHGEETTLLRGMRGPGVAQCIPGFSAPSFCAPPRLLLQRGQRKGLATGVLCHAPATACTLLCNARRTVHHALTGPSRTHVPACTIVRIVS